MTSDDQQLLRTWHHKRDANAFREIVRRHGPMVYASCLRILRNAADAEDVVQECFFRLFAGSTTIRGSLGAWLHTVAVNASTDKVRRERRRAAREDRYQRELRTQTNPQWDDLEPIIEACIEALPPEYRELLVAYYLEQQSQEAIATDLGVTQSTVSRRIDRGVAQARALLRARGVSVPAATIASFFAATPAQALPATLSAVLAKAAISGSPLAPTLVSGGFVMAKTTNVVGGVIAAVVLASALAVWMLAIHASPDPAAPSAGEIALLGQLTDTLEDLEPIAPPRTPPTETNVAQPLPIATPSAIVRGIVRQAAAPKPGVALAVEHRGTEDAWTTTTNSRGRFEFRALPAGTYTLRVADEEVMPVPEAIEFALQDSETKDDITIELAGAGALLGGISSGGAPLPDTEVTVRIIGWGKSLGERRVTTNPSGYYRLDDVIAGDHELQAGIGFEDGYAIWSGTVLARVEAGLETRADLFFVGGEAVLDARFVINGVPATNRTIGLIAYDDSGQQVALMELTTNEDGAVTIEGLAAETLDLHAYLVRKPGGPVFAPITRQHFRSGQRNAARFAFTVGTRVLEGQITHAGEPARNASLILGGRIVTTDAQGAFHIEGLPDDPMTQSVELITPYGKVIQTSSLLIGDQDEGNGRTTFGIQGGAGRVQGAVRNEDGEPAAARVVVGYRLDGAYQQYHIAHTGPDGTYDIDQVPVGDVVIIPILRDEDFLDPPVVVQAQTDSTQPTIQDFALEP